MFLFYEFAFGQYSQMFGYCLPRRVKMLGKCVWRHCLQGKQSYNCSSCRVGDGLENISSHFLPSQFMKPIGCKCMRNCSVSQVLFFSFLKSQKLRRNFQPWRAGGSNDLFDAAWLLEADVGFLHLGYDDFSGANFSGGSVILIVDNGVPRINSNITSLITRPKLKSWNILIFGLNTRQRKLSCAMLNTHVLGHRILSLNLIIVAHSLPSLRPPKQMI